MFNTPLAFFGRGVYYVYMKNKIAKILLAAALGLSLAGMAMAAEGSAIDSALDGLKTTGDVSGLTSQSGSSAEAELNSIINNIISVVLGLTGTIFFILIFVAGQMWMNAAGNEDQVKKAQQIIYSAVGGLAVTAGAYVLSSFIVDQVLTIIGA